MILNFDSDSDFDFASIFAVLIVDWSPFGTDLNFDFVADLQFVGSLESGLEVNSDLELNFDLVLNLERLNYGLGVNLESNSGWNTNFGL